MSQVQSAALPPEALLAQYQDQGYVDCFTIDLARSVSLGDFIRAFYSTPLFRAERLVLRWAFAAPSCDQELAELAANQRETFAVWHVEAREDNQILLRDFSSRTRSWLSVVADGEASALYFGSAVVAERRRPGSGIVSNGPLLAAHRVYARALLRAAARRLASRDSHQNQA